MFGTTFAYTSQLVSGAASIWFISWATRRRYDVECQLTRNEHIVRGLIVAAGFGLAFLQGGEFEIVRIVAGIVALAFLAWPNFARTVVSLVRKGTTQTPGNL
jgi:hypothetical protein